MFGSNFNQFCLQIFYFPRFFKVQLFTDMILAGINPGSFSPSRFALSRFAFVVGAGTI